MDAFTPQRFGKFFLINLLGKGGMAAVYLATNTDEFDPFDPFKSLIALKQLFPKYSAKPGFIKCLVDEAKITSMLKHPNIVEVLDLGNVGTDFYMTINWVNGKNLNQLLQTVNRRNKVISKSFLFYIFQKVAQGLNYAHEMKDSANRPLDMVHCDISPQNILIGYEGEVKLSDFGIATAEKSKEQATNEALIGKLPYMAPEQLLMKGFDRRIDIYSFGVLMYEGLTGKKPLDSMSVHELQTKIVREIPDYTSKVFQNNIRIKNFIEACLSKDPNNRPSSISEFFALQDECADVDELKISKLMKVLFQDEITQEKKEIQSALQILISTREQEDLLSGDDDNSFVQEKTTSRATEIMPLNAGSEKTQVVFNPTDREQISRIQVKKQEVVRVIKKKPIEEEWIDVETTERRLSKDLVAEEKKSRESDHQSTDFFSPDAEDSFIESPTNMEKTIVDFNHPERPDGLKTHPKQIEISDKDPSQLPRIDFVSGDINWISELSEENQEDFLPAYPKTNEELDFNKIEETELQNEIPVSAESETREVPKIQLNVVKKPLSEIQKKVEPPLVLKEKSPSEDFFQEISKNKEIPTKENIPNMVKTIFNDDDEITFKIKKQTLAGIFVFLFFGLAIWTSTIKNPTHFLRNAFSSDSQDIKTIDLYVSVENAGNENSSSTNFLKDPTFQQSFIGPVQSFLEHEYERYTKKQNLPFRFVFSSLKTDTPKISWQGGLFNSYLPFDSFRKIFEIKFNQIPKDHGQLFIHLFSKNGAVTSEYPIDYKGDRPSNQGVVYYSLASESDNEFQLRLAHEILHMLGAKDLYNSKGFPKYPEGYAEPFNDPLHPQKFGEIMSRAIAESSSSYIPLSSLEDAKIGPSTARQIGWITVSQEQQYYRK